MQRCPTCGHWWLRRPAWWQFWRWPAYWTRCSFLDLYLMPIPMNQIMNDPELRDLFS